MSFQRCQALSVSYQTIPARHPHLCGDSLDSYVYINRDETRWANQFVLQTCHPCYTCSGDFISQ